MTVQEVLHKTQSFFKTKGFATSRLDAELLISHSLGWERMSLYTKFSYPMNEVELANCREIVRRRTEGEPVAYILGKKGFYKEEFFVTPDVLIPRPETECMVEKIVESFDSEKQPIKIFDFGTGSGCLGLSLLLEFKEAHLTAIDISAAAIEVAKKNATKLSVENRVEFICSDLSELVNLSDNLSNADIIVANPPYIAAGDIRLEESVKRYEPQEALIAENGGLDLVYRWTEQAFQLLAPGGHFYCEIGEGQRHNVEDFLNTKFSGKNLKFEFYQDYSGIDRGFIVIKE